MAFRPRGATLENPIPPLAFWPKPLSLFGLPRSDDAYRRLPGLTLSPDPSPHPASRLPGRDPSHDFLLSPAILEIRYIVGGAPHRHGCTMEACPPRVPVAEHRVWSLLLWRTNNRARQATTRHRVATNGWHVRWPEADGRRPSGPNPSCVGSLIEDALSGYWSRRITDEHRIVYKVERDSLLIAQLRFHC